MVAQPSAPSLLELLAAQVRARPEQPAIVESTVTTRYGELWRRISGFARTLAERGIKRGDRVALWLDNSADSVAAYYACLSIGAVVAPLNTALKPPQVGALLDHAQAGMLVYRGRSAAEIDWPGPRLDGETVADGEGDAVAGAQPTAADEAATILYTSGTTGQPKGVTLSGRNLVANTRAIIESLGITADERHMCVLPFYYAYGNSVLHSHLAAGATLILENNFLYPHRILERMRETAVTSIAGVPATYALLMNRCDLGNTPLPALRTVTQAGGPMPAEQIRQLLAVWPDVRFFVMYGQTEATARLTYLPPERLSEKIDTVGIPIPGVDISIRDGEGAEVPAGETGEICARGPNIMLGYWRDAEATRKKFFGPWLRTGDEGCCDAEGFLTIVGRRSDMIKSGAHRIAPEEIEQVIARLPGVEAVAVAGLPDAMLGEVIKAWVVKQAAADLDKRAVLAHCNTQLPKYKLPKEVVFVDALPRTASGKIQRFKLVSAAGGAQE